VKSNGNRSNGNAAVRATLTAYRDLDSVSVSASVSVRLTACYHQHFSDVIWREARVGINELGLRIFSFKRWQRRSHIKLQVVEDLCGDWRTDKGIVYVVTILRLVIYTATCKFCRCNFANIPRICEGAIWAGFIYNLLLIRFCWTLWKSKVQFSYTCSISGSCRSGARAKTTASHLHSPP
jgi:hypothetical protein